MGLSSKLFVMYPVFCIMNLYLVSGTKLNCALPVMSVSFISMRVNVLFIDLYRLGLLWRS